jgi:hypothetical protein
MMEAMADHKDEKFRPGQLAIPFGGLGVLLTLVGAASDDATFGGSATVVIGVVLMIVGLVLLLLPHTD